MKAIGTTTKQFKEQKRKTSIKEKNRTEYEIWVQAFLFSKECVVLMSIVLSVHPGGTIGHPGGQQKKVFAVRSWKGPSCDTGL